MRIAIVFNPEFLHEAIQLSVDKMQSNAGGPFGAVIVCDDLIIARGWNQVTSTNDPTAHAEIVAIREACSRLETFSLQGCEIYSSCEPCPLCLAAIYWARLDGIYYAASCDDAAAAGFDDRNFYREFSSDRSERSIPMEQSMQEEAQIAFELWKKKADRINY